MLPLGECLYLLLLWTDSLHQPGTIWSESQFNTDFSGSAHLHCWSSSISNLLHHCWCKTSRFPCPLPILPVLSIYLKVWVFMIIRKHVLTYIFSTTRGFLTATLVHHISGSSYLFFLRIEPLFSFFNLKPRYVPRPVIEPTTFWYSGWRSSQPSHTGQGWKQLSLWNVYSNILGSHEWSHQKSVSAGWKYLCDELG